jgi:hypothetical protein
MPNDLRQRLRKALLESYLHRPIEGTACARCRRQGVPLALHVIEESIPEVQAGAERAKGFEPMSSSGGYVKRAFPPLCRLRAPCKHCKLPTDPLAVHKFAISVQAKMGQRAANLPDYCSFARS